jgi:hypothetical protein
LRFLENFTKNFKPLYVVTAEMKRQQKREKQDIQRKEERGNIFYNYKSANNK